MQTLFFSIMHALNHLFLGKYHARISAGSTELTIEKKFKHALYPVMILPSAVPELNSVQELESELLVGANVSLTVLNEVLSELIRKKPEEQTAIFAAFVDQLRFPFPPPFLLPSFYHLLFL